MAEKPVDAGPIMGGWQPTLPLFLRLQGRPCLLVGGDVVARDRAEALLQAGARLTVVATHLEEGLHRLAMEGKLHWLAEPFQPAHLDGAWLVINTQTDPQLWQAIWREAEQRRIFVNTVDIPEGCSVYWPAVIQRHPVIVAVATGGVSPALAGYLRRKIAAVLPASMQGLADWLSQWRGAIARQLPNHHSRARLWKNLMARGVVEQFLAGQVVEADRLIQQTVEQATHRDPMIPPDHLQT